ncbi:MAG: hypothetical protein ABIE46_01280, partial [Patescibacteria group bacterium]
YSDTDRLSDQQSQQFAPSYVTNQEVIHENLIDQKQMLEDSIAAQQLSASPTEAPPDEGLPLKGPMGGSAPAAVDAGAAAAGLAEPAGGDNGAAGAEADSAYAGRKGF